MIADSRIASNSSTLDLTIPTRLHRLDDTVVATVQAGPDQTDTTALACRKVGPNQAVTPRQHQHQVGPNQAVPVGPDQPDIFSVLGMSSRLGPTVTA